MKAQEIRLVQGSKTYEIYQFFLRNGAMTSVEVMEKFSDLGHNGVSKYLTLLREKGLIIRSEKQFQSPTRRDARLYVYGINQASIDAFIHKMLGSIDEEKFLIGLKKHIFEIIQVSPIGMTLSEVVYKLREIVNDPSAGNWDYIGNNLREFSLSNLISRSSFRIPAKCMIHGKKPGYVYGKDGKAVFDKILKLMPEEVRKSFLEIMQSNEIFPIDVLSKKFGIDDSDFRMWYLNRIIPEGWVKTYSYKQRKYFYNSKLTEEYVSALVPKIHEEIVINSILENSTLGCAFEKQAVFYYVWYLILKRGRQIRLNKDFPKKIPSWFNRDDIRNPEYVVLDEKGEPTGKTLVDIWCFDNEPFDYIINTYDNILESPAESYVISIKRDQNRKYLGVAGKRYIAAMFGCISLGMSLDGRKLPQRQFMPVLIVNGVNSDKLFKFAQKINCEVFWKSRFQKLIDFCNQHSIVYSDDKVLAELQQEFNLLERYQNHESVLLGKVTPEQLVRLKK